MSRGNINKMVIAAACLVNILVGYLTRNNIISTALGGITILVVLTALAGYFINEFLKHKRSRK